MLNKETIKMMIFDMQDDISEIDEIIEDEDFNPCDASGGNFDDAYQMGYDHGYSYGKLEALSSILKMME